MAEFLWAHQFKLRKVWTKIKKIRVNIKTRSRMQMTSLPTRRFLLEPGMSGSLKDRQVCKQQQTKPIPKAKNAPIRWTTTTFVSCNYTHNIRTYTHVNLLKATIISQKRKVKTIFVVKCIVVRHINNHEFKSKSFYITLKIKPPNSVANSKRNLGN